MKNPNRAHLCLECVKIHLLTLNCLGKKTGGPHTVESCIDKDFEKILPRHFLLFLYKEYLFKIITRKLYLINGATFQKDPVSRGLFYKTNYFSSPEEIGFIPFWVIILNRYFLLDFVGNYTGYLLKKIKSNDRKIREIFTKYWEGNSLNLTSVLIY